MTIAITGAAGFIGKSLCAAMLEGPHKILAGVRSMNSLCPSDNLRLIQYEGLSPGNDNFNIVQDATVVVHTAARAHIVRDKALDPLAEYRRVNVQGTLDLARRAAFAGVKRFVFISSIGVNGTFTSGSRRFTRDHKPAPTQPYAVSKWEAEQGLWEIASQTGIEVVVVRPPLVYGPGVKGNFARLLDLVRSGVPLPLAAVNNRRSFIGLDNLVDLLIRCVDHPNAAGQTLLVSDGQDLSTPELLRMIANAIGRPARLFPLPVPLLRLAGRALGRLNEVDRLVGSLQVDSSATRDLLGWTPPVSVEEGIKRMVTGTQRA
jgi:nucleoside-diphosphate-sugar epimerase